MEYLCFVMLNPVTMRQNQINVLALEAYSLYQILWEISWTNQDTKKSYLEMLISLIQNCELSHKRNLEKN